MNTVRTVSAAMKHVRRGEDIQSRGIGGAVYVRRDVQTGHWCCHYWRKGWVRNSGLFPTVDHVHDWLREFFPRLRGPDPRGDHRRTPATRPLERPTHWMPLPQPPIRAAAAEVKGADHADTR